MTGSVCPAGCGQQAGDERRVQEKGGEVAWLVAVGLAARVVTGSMAGRERRTRKLPGGNTSRLGSMLLRG